MYVCIFEVGLSSVRDESLARNLSQICRVDVDKTSGVVILDSPLALTERLLGSCSLFFCIEFNAGVGDTKKLEDQFIMSYPWSNPCGVVPEEHTTLVSWDVVKGNSIRLDSSSTHVPYLITSSLVIKVFLVSSVGHVECTIEIGPRYFDHITERAVTKGCGKLLPAINLITERSIKSRPIIIVQCFK